MPSYVQVLGGGTKDGGGSSLLLFFNDRRYLFNCGEGTQRYCGQHHLKLSRLQAVFLPRLEWDRTGGLPGMICTLADAGAPALTIIGPRNTAHWVACLRAFLRRSAFSLTVTEVADEECIWEDDLIKVSSIELFELPSEGSRENGTKRTCTPPEMEVENMLQRPIKYSTETKHSFVLKMFKDPGEELEVELGSSTPVLSTPVLSTPVLSTPVLSTSVLSTSVLSTPVLSTPVSSNPNSPSTHDRMPSTTYRNTSMCFIIEGPTVPGKFNAARAKELGVPVGPSNGQLAKGLSITLPDGRVVSPSECVAASTPGGVFVIVDVASPGQVKDLLRKRDRLIGDARLSLVFHNCPAEIYQSAEYVEFRESIPSSVSQVWINDGNNMLSFPSGAIILRDLANNLDSNVFRIPVSDKCPDGCAQPLTKYHWHPPGKVDLIDTTEYDQLCKSSAELETMTSTPSYSPSRTDPVIMFLGTGAALPGKYRNVSATLVDFGDSAYLLDCGEGTLGQLYRCLGNYGAMAVLRRLRAVFISHLHADHQVGLPGVLRAMNEQVLNIVAPLRYGLFLEELAECANLGPPSLHYQYNFYNCEQILEDPSYREQVCKVVGLEVCEVVPVVHCPRSFGFVIKNLDGIQITYSGDTRPCDELIVAGKGSTLLIHEATFCDALGEEAIAKRHSTLTEAITVGRAMGAEYTLLTHISQRYAKRLPPYDWPDKVLPVIDMMAIQLSGLRSTDLGAFIGKMIDILPVDENIEEE